MDRDNFEGEGPAHCRSTGTLCSQLWEKKTAEPIVMPFGRCGLWLVACLFIHKNTTACVPVEKITY